jgi:hypothetical protein
MYVHTCVFFKPSEKTSLVKGLSNQSVTFLFYISIMNLHNDHKILMEQAKRTLQLLQAIYKPPDSESESNTQSENQTHIPNPVTPTPTRQARSSQDTAIPDSGYVFTGNRNNPVIDHKKDLSGLRERIERLGSEFNNTVPSASPK